MINLNEMNITEVQFFDQSFDRNVSEFEIETVKAYSANIILDSKLVIQISGNDEEAHFPEFPHSDDCYYNDKTLQDKAHEELDGHDAEQFLIDNDIENSFCFLEKVGDEF